MRIPLGVVAGGHQQGRGNVGTDPGGRKQPRVGIRADGGDRLVELADFGSEGPMPTCQQPECSLGRRGGIRNGSGAHPGTGRERRLVSERRQRAPQVFRCIDDQVTDLVGWPGFEP